MQASTGRIPVRVTATRAEGCRCGCVGDSDTPSGTAVVVIILQKDERRLIRFQTKRSTVFSQFPQQCIARKFNIY